MSEPKMPGDSQRSRRRFSGNGLSLKSVSLTIIVIVVLLAVGGSLLGRIEPEFVLAGEVISTQVEETDSECVWLVEVELRNTSDRSMSLRTAELKGIDNSGFSILGTIDVSESANRTYQYRLPSCQVTPSDLDTNELIVHFTLRLSTVGRTTTIALQ